MVSILVVGDDPVSIAFLSELAIEESVWVLLTNTNYFQKNITSSELIIENKASGLRKLEISGISSSLYELAGEEFDIILLAVPVYNYREYIEQINQVGLTTKCIIMTTAALGIDRILKKVWKENKSFLRAVGLNIARWNQAGNIEIIYEEGWYVGSLLSRTSLNHTYFFLNTIISDKIKLVNDYRKLTNIVWLHNITYSALFYPALILGSKLGFLVENLYARELINKIIDEGLRAARLNNCHISINYGDVYRIARSLRDTESPVTYFWQRNIPSEVDYYNGAIVELSLEKGVKAPVNEVMRLMVKILENMRGIVRS